VPILFFGDLYRYRTSPCKIVTVGLNPSRIEFPQPDRFTRFKAAKGLYPAIMQSDEPYAAYVAAPCNYFIDDPYRAWFRSLEPILQGAASSYYPGRANCALHTDLCSPLATDPCAGCLAHPGLSQGFGPSNSLFRSSRDTSAISACLAQ